MLKIYNSYIETIKLSGDCISEHAEKLKYLFTLTIHNIFYFKLVWSHQTNLKSKSLPDS